MAAAEPVVVLRLREFKQQILSAEEQQMKLMARRWLAVEERLDADIAALSEQIARMKAEGQAVPIARIYRLERARKLLAQAEEEFGKYAQWADGLITSRQTQMAMLGLEHAQEALGLVTTGMAWDRLNADAVSNMVGMTGEGQPLGELLKLRMAKDATGLALPGVSERLAQTLVNATAQGWNPRKTARLIQDDLTAGLDKALVIARTEQLRVYRQASADQYRASGVVDGQARLCSHSDRTCIACLADEGTVYPVDVAIPDHPVGRCVGVPHVMGEGPPKFTTGEQWFNAQDEKTQRSMMGPGRYDLWKQGKVKFSDLGQTTHHETWGGGLKVTPVRELVGA